MQYVESSRHESSILQACVNRDAMPSSSMGVLSVMAALQFCKMRFGSMPTGLKYGLRLLVVMSLRRVVEVILD